MASCTLLLCWLSFDENKKSKKTEKKGSKKTKLHEEVLHCFNIPIVFFSLNFIAFALDLLEGIFDCVSFLCKCWAGDVKEKKCNRWRINVWGKKRKDCGNTEQKRCDGDIKTACS